VRDGRVQPLAGVGQPNLAAGEPDNDKPRHLTRGQRHADRPILRACSCHRYRPKSRPERKQTCAQHVGPAATVRDGSPSAAAAGRSRHGEHHGARKPPGGSRDRRQQPGCLRRPAPAHQLGHPSGSRICVANYASSMLGVAWGLPAWRTDAPAEAARAVAAEETVAATLRTRRAPRSADMARSRWQERSALIPSGAGCAGSNPAGGAPNPRPKSRRRPRLTAFPGTAPLPT
jgi:hypothetical protein